MFACKAGTRHAIILVHLINIILMEENKMQTTLPVKSTRNSGMLAAVDPDTIVAQRVGATMDVYALADRILELHPQANDISDEEALYMAQLSLVTGASVMTDDAEVKIYTKRSGERIIMLSVFYFERRAREAGHVMYFPESREMTGQERTRYQVQGTDLAVISKGIAFTELERLRELGVSMNQILGNKDNRDGCLITGWGVVSQKEMDEGRPETGGTWYRTAERRAKKHLLKKIFGLPDPRLQVGLFATENESHDEEDEDTSILIPEHENSILGDDIANGTVDDFNAIFFGD